MGESSRGRGWKLKGFDVQKSQDSRYLSNLLWTCARASLPSFPTVALADVCLSLLTQEPVILYNVYFSVRITGSNTPVSIF